VSSEEIVRSGIPDQRTTLSPEVTLLSAVSANSIQHSPSSDASKSHGSSRTPPPRYGTRRFATQFTRVPMWSLTRDKCLQFILFQRIFSRSHFNIILPSTLKLSKLSVPFSFSDGNFVRISRLSHACYMLCASNFSSFNHLNNKC
jgi:hypothetical protein